MLKLIFPIVLTLFIKHLNKSYKWLTVTASFIVFTLISVIYLPSSSLSYEIWNINLIFDRVTALLTTLTLWVISLIILARYKIIHTKSMPNIFILTINILYLLLALTFSRRTLILFYIWFEATLLPTIFLIIIWGTQPERLQASLYFLVYTIIASLPLLIGLCILLKKNNSLRVILNLWNIGYTSYPIVIWWLAIIFAFLVKIPIFTTHLWLPKAHVEAPVAGSIILAAILLKLGRYGLIRVSSMFPFINLKLFNPLVAVSIIGAIVSRFICLRQHDLKAIIAYASIGHIAFLISAALSSIMWGWQGTIAIIIAHGLTASRIFSYANIIYEITHTRRLFIIKGLLTLSPSISIWLFIILISNISAPPSINLLSEIMIITSITSICLTTLPLIFIRSLLCISYSLYLYSTTQHGEISNYINPMWIFSSRNIITIILHISPRYLISVNIRLVTILWWPYSWKTTLNCKFNSVGTLLGLPYLL